MSGLRKNLIRTAVALLVILLLLGRLALAPRWINLDPVKTRILETASRAFGAKLSYDRMDLTLFPRPRIVLRGARVSIPGTADGTIGALDLTPTIVSLLRKDVRLSRIRADAPDFRIVLPPADKDKEKPLTLRRVREQTARLLSALSGSVPGLVIELSRGRLALLRDGRVLHAFTDLSARIVAPPGTLRAEAACASTLWERMTAELRLDPDGLKAKGKIRVTRLSADRFASLIPSRAAFGYSGAVPDVEIDFGCDDFRALRADFKGSIPAISLRRAARRLAARAVRFSGAVSLDGEALALTGLRLSSDAPPLKASGAFSLALPASRASLSFQAENVDVPAVREGVLAFAGDVAPLPDVFDWLRGGTVPAFSFASQGRSLAALGTLDAITLGGSLRNGKLHVGPGKLDLEEVSGDVSLARGVLTAVRVSARSGNSRTTDASVAVSFGRKGTPFRVEAPIRGDLSQLPAVMARIPLPRDAAALFADISSLAGSASGRLTIEGDGASVRTGVTASAIRLSGRHRKIPFPVAVDGGTFSLSGSTIRVGGLSGAVGRTKFSGVDARLRTGGDYPVDNVSGRFEADIGEIFPLAASLPGVKAATGGVAATGGTVDLSLLRLEGPLARPGEVRFEGTGSLREIRLEGGKLPGPLSLRSGGFRVTPETLSCNSLQVSLLDAELRGSGAWTGYREGRRAFEASELGGVIGAEAARRLLALGKVPPAYSPRAPIELAGVRARYGGDNDATLSGTFSVHGGPVVGLDLSVRPGMLDIRSASLRDDVSDATASLTHSPGGLALRFKGRLAASSIGRLFPARETGQEWISGDIRIAIPNDNVLRLSANGKLEAKAIRFPELMGPLAVTRLSLDAAGDRLSVSSADLAWDGKPFTLEGTLVNGAGGLSVDLDVHAGDLAWEALDRALNRFDAAPRASGQPWRLPVTGTLRVSADAFTWNALAWKPVRADVVLEPHAVSVNVKEAELCGISMPGIVRASAEGTSVDFKAAASGRAVDATLACLGDNNFRVTGTYALTAHLAGRGRGAEALVTSLKGPVSFEARKGRIHKANVLMKVLALLNVTQILVGQLPDLAQDGFAYNSLGFSGDVGNGRLVVPGLVLDASSANIAAQGEIDLLRKTVDGVLVASPFKTVDTIIRMIPIVRYILKGRLLAVPFKVRGAIGDPEVSIIPTAGVGSGLLGILERTLKLPVHLIAPLLPKDKAPPETPPAGVMVP